MSSNSPVLQKRAENISTAENQKNFTKINSIDILRLICAIMVVAIHTQPLSEYENLTGYIATYVFPRLGVPFFFAVSGYSYISGLIQGKKVFVKYIKRLLTIYILWSLIYYLVDFTQVMSSNSSLTGFLKSCFFDFLITGSHYQLWFFPVLISCVILVTVLRRHLVCLSILSFLLYGGGCLVGAYYYKVGSKIPLINNLYHSQQLETVRRYLFMGLPFFMLGYILIHAYKKLGNVKNKTLLLSTGIITGLFLIEIFIGRALGLQANIITTVFLYPLLLLVLTLCLRYPLPQLDTTARFCKTSANFMYYSHPLFILVMAEALPKQFSMSLGNTSEFLLICVSTVISSYIIYIIDNKYLNKLVQ